MNSTFHFSEFKDEANHQVIDFDLLVARVTETFATYSHSLYVLIEAVKPTRNERHAHELQENTKEILYHEVKLMYCSGLIEPDTFALDNEVHVRSVY